ncbi:putative FCP1 domain, HAD superfamily protein [Septoria linicola]|nr:putative FCP1 domain, HAD superfamily protein [Septoria linicola]
MNSLSSLARLATPGASPPRTRKSSLAHVETLSSPDSSPNGSSDLDVGSISEKLGHEGEDEISRAGEEDAQSTEQWASEKTPLLDGGDVSASGSEARSVWRLPHRIGAAVLYGVKVVFSTVTAPGRYVIACFYDEEGHFSTILPLSRLKNLMTRQNRRRSAQQLGLRSEYEDYEKPRSQRKSSAKRSPSVDSNSSAMSCGTSDGEGEDSPARHTRSKTSSSQSPSEALPKKSIRIKENSLRKRKDPRARTKAASADDAAAVAPMLKSPTSSAVSKLKYPRSPATPRPLVPRRQPSYILSYASNAPKKTLIIDLDETLIHSMAKSNRMSTGHMVEVRLNGQVSSSGVQIGPGVPILYYVHERPGCHEFLRKVSKWYNLIAFTASVQEYADPVVDWLERERKYFSGRYYRQHCTYRNGAYIKDLAQVEPDLSKVMILDNSPMSYIFHEDNAIPIEGWISDPTDHELLHLIPLLEGLQYCTDVRALLALRHGQAQQA